MKKCIIYAGGEPEPNLPAGLDTQDAYIIAADSGYLGCKTLGLSPQLAVGDFDSLGFTPEDCELVTFPKEKDDTDLMLAVKEALSRGCIDITILGATGGRTDHLLANIQTLAYIRSHGAWGRILSCRESIALVTPGRYKISAKEGYSLSLLAYSEEVSGLSISGVKYPLKNGVIKSSFPLGVSNEITSESAEIEFIHGTLLIIQSAL